MAKKTDEVKKLNDTYTVKFEDGEEKELKMSMGLIQLLFARFTTQDQIYNLGLDFIVQRELINEVVDDRSTNGRRANPDIDYSLRLSIEEGNKLVEWISEHIIDFFTSKLEAQERAIKKMLPALEEVNKTLDKVPTVDKESNPA